MSYNLVDPTTGDLTQVAGRGRAEYGASTVRKGTVNVTGIPASGSKAVAVVFDTPMPDADYEVIFSVDEWVIQATEGSWNKSANGFNVILSNTWAAEKDVTVTYYAFKLYSDVEYSNIVNSIPASASSSNKLTTMTEVKTLFTTPIRALLVHSIPATFTVDSTHKQMIVVKAQLKDFIPSGYKLYKATLDVAWTSGNTYESYMAEVISSGIALTTSGANKEAEFKLFTKGEQTPGASYSPWNAYNCIIECVKE